MIVDQYMGVTSQDTFTVGADVPVPGLYVYQAPEGVDRDSPFRWRIGHDSGKCVAFALNRHDALRGASLLGDLLDWSLPDDAIRELMSDEAVREMYADLSMMNCFRP